MGGGLGARLVFPKPKVYLRERRQVRMDVEWVV